MPEQTPSIGRVVHFVLDDGQHRPAFIVRVWSESTVNLLVFTDSDPEAQFNDRLPQVMWKTSVVHAPADENKPFSWHWPEYVPPKESD